MTNLFDQINNDIKTAMLAREKVALETLRGIKKEFLEAKNRQRRNGRTDRRAGVENFAKTAETAQRIGTDFCRAKPSRTCRKRTRRSESN